MKYLHISFLTVFLISCSQGLYKDIPSDFYVMYYYKNHLMDNEVKIEINCYKLKLSFKNYGDKKNKEKTFQTTEEVTRELYKYFKSVNFHLINSPEKEKLLDAPEIHITGTYNNKTTVIDYGSVRNIPDNIRKIESKIFELMTHYHRNWKKEVGFE